MNTTQGVASSQDTLLTCKITFLKVLNVPVADLHNLSCDPYLQATLSAENNIDTDPQIITYRTHTCRQELNPEFNASWIVSGVPSSGFLLSVRLRDEDPGNYDDNLGKAVLEIPNPNEGKLSEGWKSGDREYKVRKRKGSILSQVFTFTARALTRGDIGHRVRLWVRVEVLGKAENQDDRRLYTVGPRKSPFPDLTPLLSLWAERYVRHFSPLLGIFLGTTNSPDEGKHTGATMKPSAFIANRVQLAGPIPSTLRHRYVGFAPFVKAMFRRRGIRGILLHHALHRQHVSIYKWDKNVVWGVIGDHDEMPQGEEKERERKPTEEQDGSGHDSDSIAMARQFLRMTSHGTNGRMFTYVIMLDGEFRFTVSSRIRLLKCHTDIACRKLGINSPSSSSASTPCIPTSPSKSHTAANFSYAHYTDTLQMSPPRTVIRATCTLTNTTRRTIHHSTSS